jgi:hypothetical protein
VLELSQTDLTLSFSYRFLWCVLSLFHYLDEDVAKENLGRSHLKWSRPFNDLAGWATDEWYYLLDSRGIDHDSINRFDLVGGKLGDSLTYHFAGALTAVAADTHAETPALSDSMWLYYFYCRFIWRVLKEFDRVLQELGDSSAHYGRYQDSIGLFQNMHKAMELERPFLDSCEVSDATKNAVWDKIDAHAEKLGLEWREAVRHAACYFEIPDFDADAV